MHATLTLIVQSEQNKKTNRRNRKAATKELNILQ